MGRNEIDEIAVLPGASRVRETFASESGPSVIQFPENYAQMTVGEKLNFLDTWLTGSRRDIFAKAHVVAALNDLDLDSFVPSDEDEKSLLFWAKQVIKK